MPGPGYGRPPCAGASELLLAVSLPAVLARLDRVLTIHLDVLSGMAGKMVAIADVGRRPSSNDITEMVYPLERGRLFLRQYEKRQQEESYRQFAQFLERYAALAAAVDDARTDEKRWATLREHLPTDARDLRDRVAAIRAVLAGPA